MLNVTLADITGIEIYPLPIIHDNSIDLRTGADNYDYETVNGKIRIPGPEKLDKVTIKSIFAQSNDLYLKNIGLTIYIWSYVEFLKDVKKNKTPIRVIITDHLKKMILNKLMTIDDFNYKINSIGNINYELNLTEFPENEWGYIDTLKNTVESLKSLHIKNRAKKALEKFNLI